MCGKGGYITDEAFEQYLVDQVRGKLRLPANLYPQPKVDEI